MDNTQFQTSFIPKKPIMAEPLRHVARSDSRSISIFTILAFIFVLLAGGSYAGLYFYKASLNTKIETSKKTLARAKESFEPETIADLQLFDKRIAASKEVLASHMVVSPFFELLNSLTIPSIQFSRFTAEGGTNGDNFTVKMSGNAKDYKSIAVQASVFNSSAGKYFKDVVFSNLTLSEEKESKGYVTFTVTFTVDPVLLSYEKQILNYKDKKDKIIKTPTQNNVLDTVDFSNINDTKVEPEEEQIDTQKPVESKQNIKKTTQ